MMTENTKSGCSQRDSAEHEGYAKVHRSFNSIWKERNSAQPELLEKILNKDNLNRAFKRVKANKGAPGIDGITVDEIGAYLKENQQMMIAKIYKGKYTPDAVRRVEIPKPDGGVRKLGIPTVKDRIFQQAITQQLMPIYEPLFSDNSYGYRPGRCAKDAIKRIKECAEQGYTHAVALDLQDAVISTVTENYSNVYHGVREGYSGGYQPMAEDFEEALDYGDIYDKMDTILGLTVQNGYHTKPASDTAEIQFKIWGLDVEIENEEYE